MPIPCRRRRRPRLQGTAAGGRPRGSRYHPIPRKYRAIHGRNRLIPNKYHMIPREYHAIRGRNRLIHDRYRMIPREYHAIRD
uniref:Uncharacterized protein n=1 Tax=Oryza rufipogon TaxID=4529 RepID=A0A0E0QJR5_ORYRU